MIRLRPLSPLLGFSAARYIERHATQYRPIARKLSIREMDAMSWFFPADTLHRSRISAATGPLQPPRIQRFAKLLGYPDLLSHEFTAAITFINVVVYFEPMSLRTLFHELVHVEQYKQLKGAGTFAKLYVRGYLRTGDYQGIPLERHAYELDARYAANPALSFSVRDEVARAIAEARY